MEKRHDRCLHVVVNIDLPLSLLPSLPGAEKVLLVSSTQTVVEVKQLSKSAGTTTVPSICNMEIKVCTHTHKKKQHKLCKWIIDT